MRVWLFVLAACGRVGFDVEPCTTDGLLCAQPASASCNGKCWAWCSDLVDEPETKALCAAWGGTVLSLPTLADAACFRTAVEPTGSAWLGLEQAPGSPTPDVGWSWNSDGLPLAYTSWDTATGQPDDNHGGVEVGEEQCARSRPGTSTWFDLPCSETHQPGCVR